MWKGENGENRPAIIQSFDSRQRVSEIMYLDKAERETVSVLEIDPGTTQNYGAGVGNVVLLCDDNGASPPEVPSLGQWDISADPYADQEDVIKEAANINSIDPSTNTIRSPVPRGDPSSVDWWGEVIALHPDGGIEIRLANGQTRTVGLKNLYMLRGTPEDAMGGWEDMMEDGSELFAGMTSMAGITPPASGIAMMMGPGMAMMTGMMMHPHPYSDDDWTDDDGSDEEMGVDEERRPEAPWLRIWHGAPNDPARHLLEVPGDMAWEPEIDDEERQDAEEAERMMDEASSKPTSPEESTAALPKPDEEMPAESEAGPSRRNDEIGWDRFDVLDEAPDDHHFFSQPTPTPQRAFLSRVAKEHAALRSSLPENILVRTYENRSDLVRCLIIGPEGTPYANAPFAFDVYLDPSKFPKEPPKVHFHSHTNGHGRCNPNLYEDGKVCLSVLGTWSGEKSESWK